MTERRTCTPAQVAAQKRNWFTRQLRGAIGNLGHFAYPLNDEDRADLDTAMAALNRMNARRTKKKEDSENGYY